jgi:hypothetical protein
MMHFVTKYGLFLALVVIAIGIVGWRYMSTLQLQHITTFSSCVAAGYPVFDSSPAQCRTPDGRSFTQSFLPGDTPFPSISAHITVKGEFVCLPHKDQKGPQTLECAFGLRGEDGTYYALKDSDPTYKNVSGLPSGKKISVTGLFIPQSDTKYQSIGVIEVISVEKLRERGE